MDKPLPVKLPLDFSLVQGGPLFQALVRSRMSGANLELLKRRILLCIAITWMPLLLLSAATGHLVDDATGVPFLFDAAMHARFLAAVPLLFIAEIMSHGRIGKLVNEFVLRGIIPPEKEAQYAAAIASGTRLRNSIGVEILMLAIVFAVVAFYSWPLAHSVQTSTWFFTRDGGVPEATAAGVWYCFVSLPLFQFLLLRWYFRMFVWARFLWQVSRIELNLTPTHPDRLGGLGFLSASASAFVPLAVAHGVLLSGMLANRIFHLGMTLPQFKAEIVAVTLFMLALVFLPLTVFWLQLARAKRNGALEYGRLADGYVRAFDGKWMRGGAPADEPLIGSADVQSLADMGTSYQVVVDMKPFPVSLDAVLRVVLATLLPLLPLLLTVTSAEELAKKLLGILL